MSQTLTDIEKQLIDVCLRAASDIFGRKGCNDFSFEDSEFYGYSFPKLTPEQRRELLIKMEEWNGDKVELERLSSLKVGDSEFDYTADFYLMSYLAARLRGDA